MSEKKSTSSLSGVSIALGFIAVGLVYGYWLKGAFGSATRYVAAILILIGVLGFFLEVQRKITNKNFRFDNFGIGLLLLIPAIYGSYVIDKHFSPGWKAISLTVTGLIMLVGFMAALDMVVSVFEELVKSKDFKQQIVGLFKFLAIVASSTAAILAALQQFIH